MAIPSAPTGLMNETGRIENVLTWQPVTGAVSYKIYRNADTTPLVTGLTNPTYIDLVALGSNFVYTVTAVNADGESPKSYYCQAVANGNTRVSPLVLALGNERWVNPPASSSSSASA